MPLMVVDRAGLRVVEYKDPSLMTAEELKNSYFALIPTEFLPHIKELGMIFQIPLPLNRDRKSFANEDFYLREIQKHVAVAFVKALAYKKLNDVNSFTFYGFAEDSLSNVGNYADQYNPVLHPEVNNVVAVATAINQGRVESISVKQLTDVLTMQSEQIVKLIKLLELPDRETGELASLYLRRLNYLQEIDRQQAERELQRLADMSQIAMGNNQKVDWKAKVARSAGSHEEAAFRVGQGKDIKAGHSQMNTPEKYVVQPRNIQEKQLVVMGEFITKLLDDEFSISSVELVEGVAFAGAFGNKGNKKVMYLNRSLAGDMGSQKYGGAIIENLTDIIIHELAHALEAQTDGKEFVSDLSTHQPIGRFADAMKYLSGRYLVEYDKHLENDGKSISELMDRVDKSDQQVSMGGFTPLGLVGVGTSILSATPVMGAAVGAVVLTPLATKECAG
jgi:hypothetical protein